MTLPRITRALIALALAAGLAVAGLAVAGPGGAEGKHTRIERCSVKSFKYPNTNPGGYFTSLRVRSTSCRTGRAVARAWYSCRVRNGGLDGECNRRTVRRYRCTERRPEGSQSQEQINAKVTCRRGRHGLVIHTYQQNLE